MKRTQIAWVIIIVFVLVGVSSFWLAEPIVSYWLAGVLLFMLPLTYKLTLWVDDDYVHFSFGIGLIRWKYALSNIKICRAINYFPYGWGIRFRPGVTIFNVSGNKAIELEFRDRIRKIWIGTEFPDEFAQHINSKLKID